MLTQLDSEGNCEFRAQAKGEPREEVLKKEGSGKLYRTTGKNRSQMVAHLSVPADTADPVASMTRQFNALTKDMRTRVKRPEAKGEKLMNEDGTQIVLNSQERRLYINIEYNLDKNPNIAYELSKILAKVTQCLYINREKVLNAPK